MMMRRVKAEALLITKGHKATRTKFVVTHTSLGGTAIAM